MFTKRYEFVMFSLICDVVKTFPLLLFKNLGIQSIVFSIVYQKNPSDGISNGIYLCESLLDATSIYGNRILFLGKIIGENRFHLLA
jgi:hypothetical protein